ncbi:MAG: hypothetical protein Q8904_12575 [Bacteroidota bacterium]|nr:hypothetical protein [Bacteroidota bacterium]
MKKKMLFSFVLVIGFLTLFTSCGNKDDATPDQFTSLTPEQNKQAIEDAGVTMLNQLDGVKKLSSVQTLVDFVNLADGTSSPFESVRSFVAPFAKISQNPASMMTMRAVSTNYKTIAELFSQNTGIFTYNPAKNNWVKSASSTEITFVFPTKNSSTNNASLTLGNFKSIASPHVIDLDGAYGVLVTSFDFTVKKQNSQVLSFAVTGAYNSDGLPSSLTETLSFSEGYTLESTFSNTGSAINFDQSFKKGSSVIVSNHLDTKGDFSYNGINTNEDSNDDAAIANVINSGNVWVNVGNIKVVGMVDLKSIFAEVPKTINHSRQSAVDSIATIINKHASIYAKYVDKNEFIAKSTAYSYPYTDYIYNYSTRKYDQKTYYDLNLKFVFKDGSAMDESFFNNGFDNFISQYQNLVNGIQTSYTN